MTERLYYNNSFLYDFVAALLERRVLEDGRAALVLDRTAFYPTSGGQVFDTGWLELEPLEGERGTFLPKLRVTEVAETEAGEILHVVETDSASAPAISSENPTRVRGFIDVDRRLDHMQQHSGQHVISAAFVELFQMPTVSFHMGEQSCTIDLETKGLTAEQVRQAEARTNQVICEDRPVAVQLATEDEARAMGVRKIPAAGHEKLRLVGVKDFDLCACGGTHVRSTGQIGALLVRKVEKVKQGMRVEFVCGTRAVRHARKDYETLTEAASLFSTHIWELPAQITKVLDDSRAAAKQQHKLLERIAELTAAQILSQTSEENGMKMVAQVIADGDLAYTKLLAQKLTAAAPNVVALLGAGAGQAALVYAQSPGMTHDMGALMKASMASLGGRGGGNREMAQGGVPSGAKIEEVIEGARKSVIGE
jgi:alanyl-tRNA synthetase